MGLISRVSSRTYRNKMDESDKNTDQQQSSPKPVKMESQEEAPENSETKKATLIEEFKHSFQDIWAPLVTENNALFGSSHSEEARQSLENSVMRYIDIARQLETWFAQRRIVLKTPEQEIDEEIQDLKQEIERKDNLINKVLERSGKWKS